MTNRLVLGILLASAVISRGRDRRPGSDRRRHHRRSAAARPGKSRTADADAFVFVTSSTTLRIPYARINLVEYGQDVSRRVILAWAVSPIFLLSKAHKHFITLGYTDDTGNSRPSCSVSTSIWCDRRWQRWKPGPAAPSPIRTRTPVSPAKVRTSHQRPLDPNPPSPRRESGQFPFHPLHGLVPRHDHLRDAVARVDRVRLAPEIQQDDADLAAIARVDRAGRVRHRDRVLQRQAAARPHLRFIPGRQLDRQSGRHQARRPGLQRHVLHGAADPCRHPRAGPWA